MIASLTSLVLERDISAAHISLLQETVQQFDNVRLCFCDVAPYVAGEDLSTNNEHISAETFYRFLIPELLPFYDKVLYLDSDIVVLGDVAELFDVDLKDNILAATRDIDFLGNLNGSPVSKSEFDKQGRTSGVCEECPATERPVQLFSGRRARAQYRGDAQAALYCRVVLHCTVL